MVFDLFVCVLFFFYRQIFRELKHAKDQIISCFICRHTQVDVGYPFLFITHAIARDKRLHKHLIQSLFFLERRHRHINTTLRRKSKHIQIGFYALKNALLSAHFSHHLIFETDNFITSK